MATNATDLELVLDIISGSEERPTGGGGGGGARAGSLRPDNVTVKQDLLQDLSMFRVAVCGNFDIVSTRYVL